MSVKLIKVLKQLTCSDTIEESLSKMNPYSYEHINEDVRCICGTLNKKRIFRFVQSGKTHVIGRNCFDRLNTDYPDECKYWFEILDERKKVEKITEKQRKGFKLYFGKYKGLSYDEVGKKDVDYLGWIIFNRDRNKKKDIVYYIMCSVISLNKEYIT